MEDLVLLKGVSNSFEPEAQEEEWLGELAFLYGESILGILRQ